MNGADTWGGRLRARARELGLSDSEVARRVGMTQRRYSSYVNMTREPNFADLLRVCEGLQVTPDFVLGVRPPAPAEDAARRTLAALGQLSPEHRPLAIAALEGMAGVVGSTSNQASPEQPSLPPSRSGITPTASGRRAKGSFRKENT